jgi:antibiotic biosynthesis monooxygenase (ABM) superfamily enzyme
MVSRERSRLLREMDGLGYSCSAETNWKGYAAWVAEDQEADAPPIWKVNLLVLLCLYPTVLILNGLINPLGMGNSSAILVGNVCSVALTGWLLVPAAQRVYRRWISGSNSGRGNQLALLSIATLLWLSWAISQQVSG